MPAAAVIPAPIAYIKVVAVKKLVVGLTTSAVAVRRSAPFGFARPRSSSPFRRASCVAARQSAAGAVASRQKSRPVSEVQSCRVGGVVCSSARAGMLVVGRRLVDDRSQSRFERERVAFRACP